MITLHLCFSEGWGGLEMASLQWARLLGEQPHQSFSITSRNSPLAQRLRQANMHCLELPNRRYFSPVTSWRIRQFVINNHIDAVFLQSMKDLWLVAPALIGLPTQLVGFAQMWLQNIDKNDFGHRLIYKRLNHLVTLTPTQGAQYLKCIPFPPEKSFVLPNAVDSTKYSPEFKNQDLRKEFGAGESDILIGLVGRLDPQKGQLELIKAFAQARLKNEQLKLVLVGDVTEGAGSDYKNLLQNEVEKNNLTKHVHFAGFRSNIPEIMASLDIFCLCSYQEAFGFVVVEAMMSGTAVIATNSGGVPDILQSNRYGYLIPPKEIDPLVKALLELSQSADKRKELGDRARNYALETFDETKNKKIMLNYLSNN